MALTDPQSITISGSAVSLPRTSTGENSSVYRSADGNVDLQIKHTYGRRNRHQGRHHYSKTAADPLSPTLNRPFDMSMNVVIDVPDTGFTVTEMKANVDAALAWYSANSSAIVTKLLGGES